MRILRSIFVILSLMMATGCNISGSISDLSQDISGNSESNKITISDLTIDEGQVLTVALLTPSSVNSDFDLNWTLTGTGVNDDFTTVSGTLKFVKGSQSASIVLSSVNNNYFRGNRTYELTLSPDEKSTLKSSSAQVTVKEDEGVPQLNFTLASQVKAESSGAFTIQIDASVPSFESFLISYTVAGTSSGSGVDHTLSSGIISMPAKATSVQISGSIIDDILIEGSETIVVNLTAASAYANLGTLKTHTLTITDNDFSDVTAPNAPTQVTLYSQYTNDVSATKSFSPDITIVGTETDTGGSGFSAYEYQILRVSDLAVIRAWTSVGTTKNFRASGLSLVDGETYKVQVRSKDGSGNTSSSVDSSTNWTVTEISGTPYDGLSLPSVSSLSDASYSSTSFTSLTRAAPLQAKNLSLSGQFTWNTSGHTALFLRADQLSLNPGTVISADGLKSTNATGAKGASGGGGGGSNSSSDLGANGGSSGGNGLSCISNGGSGGVGTASSYNSGYTYGNGGNGSSAASGIGGTGGNGAGGGGAGSNGNGGYGGGSGAGLVVIVANSVTGTARVTANGGGPQGPNSGNAESGAGGGGVVWVAAKTYDGNISPEVYGGGEGVSSGSVNTGYGGRGTAKIYQINSDGSLTERRFTDSWSVDVATSISVPIPMAQLPNPSSLSDLAISSPTQVDSRVYERVNPYSFKNLDLSSTLSWDTSSMTALFLYVDSLNLSGSAVIDASGMSSTGQQGAKGGSGGGAGSNSGSTQGGTGGTNGRRGGNAGTGDSGAGTAALYMDYFSYGTGGSGGKGGTTTSLGGAGSNGAGGGGSGDRGGANSGKGGGGGGGLVVIVANSISGTGIVRAKGGDAFAAANYAGGGGGGVIWIATKSYSGGISADVSGGLKGGGAATNGSAGTARIFKINTDGSLTEKLFTDSW